MKDIDSNAVQAIGSPWELDAEEPEREQDDDPTPWCHACGAMLSRECSCPGYADNH